ncbi:hypothetical protein T06_9649 [Trichinella sp. T6]|nr:hypothetical protein T06_9649 [Trichinella sp. T6]
MAFVPPGPRRRLVKIGQEVARQLEVDNAIEQVNCVHQKRLIEKPNAGPSRGVIPQVNTTVSGQARTTSNTCSASHLSYNTGVGQLHRHRPIDGLSRNLCTKKENNFDLLCNANPHRVMGDTIGFAGSSPKPSSPYGDYNYKKNLTIIMTKGSANKLRASERKRPTNYPIKHGFLCFN